MSINCSSQNNYRNNNMVIMENYYSPRDRIQDLWEEIEKSHLSYLELEESPEKIEQRNKLEEYIYEFLCVADHYRKFYFRETQEALHRSAYNKKDFSGYKAATGFNAIQLYAGNLLSQPWRTEYQQIKTYCGFYKHHIEANLVGAEMMFETMGYKHDGDGILVLDGPICPDRVAAVSRDCLIAYVECQILKAIWEEVSSSHIKITWLEVLEFRKSHICSPEQSIKALKYKQHQSHYQEHTRNYSQGSDLYRNINGQSIPVSPGMSPVIPLNHSFPPLSNHHHVGLPPLPSSHCMYNNVYCSNDYIRNASQPCEYFSVTKPHINTVNGYYFGGFAPLTPTPQLPFPYQYTVPTAQLIEVESTHNGDGYDVVDRATKSKYPLESKNVEVKKNSDKNTEFETWDYVYDDLETQGYTKDLGERGDILNPNEKLKKMSTKLEESMKNININDTATRKNQVEPQISPSSSYDNVPYVEFKKQQQLPKMNISSLTKTKTLPKEKNSLKEKQAQSHPTELHVSDKSNKKRDLGNMTTTINKKWQCKACTYLNESEVEICEICSKSRSATLEQPMEIGGAECAQCTLVNPKNSNICEACCASLKNSPTYI